MTESQTKPVARAPRRISVPATRDGGDLRGRLRFLSPLSGAVVLAVDNLLFGANAGTAMVATPLISLVAFGVTTASVFSVQRLRERDSRGRSLIKGLFCGLLAGIPTSIAGTALGGLVILASGLDRIFKRSDGNVTKVLNSGTGESKASS